MPAVQGTLSILQSALTHGWVPPPLNRERPLTGRHSKSVQRIIVTSSSAAVLQIQAEPKTFSELDWNEQAPKEAAEMGRAAPAMTKYRASKALSERGAA